jgi:uncharacterized membrane protein
MINTNAKSVSAFALGAVALAMASAAAFAATNPTGSTGAAIAAGDKVHCYSVHECKGNSDCKTAEHACKGQNACKGHGFKAMAASACLAGNGVIGDISAK